MKTLPLNASQKMKKTPIGEMPVDWQIAKLGFCATLARGRFSHRPRNEPRFYGGETPFVQTGDVSNARTRIRSHSQTLNTLGVSISRIFPRGTILMTIAANIGDCAILDFDSACPDSLVAISPNKETDVVYLVHALQMQKPRVSYLAPRGAQGNVNLRLLEDLDVALPSPSEQAQIASILTSWDSAIEQTAILLDAKRQLKAGLMQKLLTGKVRFPPSPGGLRRTSPTFGKGGKAGSNGWKTYHLGDLFDERVEIGRGDLPLLSITGDRGVVDRNDLDKKDTSNADKGKYLRIAPGDIGYNTMRMWQGVSALSTLEGIVSPAYTVCIPKADKIDGAFAAYLFKFQPVVHRFWRYSQGMVDDTLNLKFHNLAQVRVKIPPLAEQREIAALLSGCDAEIALLHKEREALREQKKGLMQKLLTGKVRVHRGKEGP